MSLSRLQELVKSDFEALNTLIANELQIHTGLIGDLTSHIISSGGKRLRPLVVLLSCHACNYKGEHHLSLAAMIEFFHTATILHDDVIDESKMRRGRETANEIWGDKISILVGDYLLTQFNLKMSLIGDMKIVRFLADITHQISCGEIKQLENRRNTSLTEADYFEVIRLKTSLLFAASACLGGLISHSPESIQKGLFDYGLHLGNAYQLIDDTLDYSADSKTIGKNIGDDLTNGSPTLPLLHALKHGSAQQQAQIKLSLTSGTLENFQDILKAIQDTRAIEYTKQLAEKEIDAAISALHILPDSDYKKALTDLALYTLSRDR